MILGVRWGGILNWACGDPGDGCGEDDENDEHDDDGDDGLIRRSHNSLI